MKYVFHVADGISMGVQSLADVAQLACEHIAGPARVLDHDVLSGVAGDEPRAKVSGALEMPLAGTCVEKSVLKQAFTCQSPFLQIEPVCKFTHGLSFCDVSAERPTS